MCYFYVLLLLLFQDTNKQTLISGKICSSCVTFMCYFCYFFNTHKQIQNDERLGLEYPDQIDSEDSETDETSEIPKVRRQILPDD